MAEGESRVQRSPQVARVGVVLQSGFDMPGGEKLCSLSLEHLECFESLVQSLGL